MLFSLIVPLYNVEKYLKRCIESLINQTYDNIEILLIDDGATDNSGKICDEIAKEDQRIKVFHRENEGVSAARNFGIEQASGGWIFFVDSDDLLIDDDIFFRELTVHMMMTEKPFIVCGLLFHFFQILIQRIRRQKAAAQNRQAGRGSVMGKDKIRLHSVCLQSIHSVHHFQFGRHFGTPPADFLNPRAAVRDAENLKLIIQKRIVRLQNPCRVIPFQCRLRGKPAVPGVLSEPIPHLQHFPVVDTLHCEAALPHHLTAFFFHHRPEAEAIAAVVLLLFFQPHPDFLIREGMLIGIHNLCIL